MLKHTFPSSALKTLYHYLTYPYYTYCNIIWGCATSTHLEPLISYKRNALESLVKRAFMNTQSLILVVTGFSQLIRYMTITGLNLCTNVTIIMFISILEISFLKIVFITTMR